jgi:uncharacterized membrane protein YcaP (DUF421 family)
MDGRLIENNLNNNGISRRWLEAELEKREKSIEDVFYAVKSTNGKLRLDFYEDGLRQPIDKES